MDKEHFHLPYLLGQAVQHQGLSQDGALGVGKGLVCVGWQSVVGSWFWMFTILPLRVLHI